MLNFLQGIHIKKTNKQIYLNKLLTYKTIVHMNYSRLNSPKGCLNHRDPSFSVTSTAVLRVSTDAD